MADDITILGKEAEYILTTLAFDKAMQELDAGIIEAWASGQFATVQEREEAFNRVRAARMFKQRLVELVNDMKVSKASADRRARFRVNAGTVGE